MSRNNGIAVNMILSKNAISQFFTKSEMDSFSTTMILMTPAQRLQNRSIPWQQRAFFYWYLHTALRTFQFIFGSNFSARHIPAVLDLDIRINQPYIKPI